MVMNLNAVNQVTQGSTVYSENEHINSVCLILKGRVAARDEGTKVVLSTGSFLGVSDLESGRYSKTYVAMDNLMLYAFQVTKLEELDNILSMNKDYSGLMIYSLTRYIAELTKTYLALKVTADELYKFLSDSYSIYKQFGHTSGYRTMGIDSFESMEKYQEESSVDTQRLEFYRASVKVPVDLLKQYYSYGTAMVHYQIGDMTVIIDQLDKECNNLTAYLSDLFEGLISDDDVCFFKGVAKLAIDVDSSGGQNSKLIGIVDNMIEFINKIENLLSERTGTELKIDRKKIEEIYFVLLTGTGKSSVSTDMQLSYSEQDMDFALNQMEGSLRKIAVYGGLDDEKIDEFEKLTMDFSNLRDKLSGDDSVRLMRRKITDIYYDLYEKIFIKAYKNKEKDRLIDMFLSYGYLDERLLSQEQLIELYYLSSAKETSGPCSIYTIKEWLTAILEGRKEPSKNEFDLDYSEAFRELKKRQMFTPEEERDYLSDPYKKLNFEITNLFRYNNRLLSGQITTFVPFLYNEGFVGNLKKIYLTADVVNQTVKYIEDIDFSAFHREAVYFDAEKGIKKEVILKQVFPDIIVFPIAGSNGVMWQDISGKKRDTSGRFLLPIFMDSSLEDTMIRMIGRFRWELCRTIQGTAWNNVSERSLTSEYVDYIQFYKKNRDLSEVRKEKLKLQIQKGKNNSREIFTMDYYEWVKHESKGAMRLNKVSRAILANYCPFCKEIREKLSTQPLFEDAMARWSRETLKKTREVELRIRALGKEGIEVPPEVEETFSFYKDL